MQRRTRDHSGLVGCLAGFTAVALGLWIAVYDIPVYCGRLILDAYHPDTGRTEAEYVTPLGIALRVAVFIGCIVLVVRELLARRKSGGV